MAKVLVSESHLQNIGEAIRSKLGGTAQYTPAQMASAIGSIEEGYPEPTGTVNISQNGTTNVKDYASANVNVSNSYSAGDEGKVVNNGALVAQSSQTITQNGTYDTTLISELIANISGGEGGSGDTPASDDWSTLKNYIESSGTQYIDTGYIVQDNSRFDIVYEASTSQSSFATIFGVRDNDSGATAGRCTVFARHNTFSVNASYAWGTADSSLGMPPRMYLSGKKQRCVFTKGSILIQQIDGNALAFEFNSTYSASTTRSLYVFSLNQGGSDYGSATHMYGKLYRFRIYENNTLVHEFIPWEDNGVACLKDTVTGNIKYNAGTGNFTYGTDL